MSTYESHIRDLVTRARAGDQNAMGMIAMVGKAARAGNPKAKRATIAIRNYINRNPVGSKFGQSTLPVSLVHAVHNESGGRLISAVQQAMAYPNAIDVVCVILSNRVPLTTKRLTAIASQFGTEDEVKVFCFAVYNPSANASKDIRAKMNARGSAFLDTGRCFGFARAIQLVRMPQSRLSRFSSAVAWELGE